MNDKSKIIEADCVSTKHLSIVDEQGRERACLTCRSEDDEYVVFDMKDTAGRPRITIQLNDSEAHVMLFTDQNAPAISIGLNGERGNGIQIGRPGDGRPHIILSVPGKDGREELGPEQSVLVIDSEGRREFSLRPTN
jgi:hypothetical protein